jgi:hypothetical protein
MAKLFQTKFKQAKTSVDRLGNKQLRVGKKYKLSGWMLFDGIVLIIIISVAAVRLTHAGGNYTFTRTPQQMQGGTLERNVITGEYRKLVSNGIHAEASASVAAEEVVASGQICAQVHVASKNTFVDIQLNGHYASKFAASAGDVTVCAPLAGETKGGTVYAGTSGNADVQSIYGLQ